MYQKDFVKRYIIPITTLVLVLVLWEVIDIVFGIKKVILPAPHEIILALHQDTSFLLYHTGITMLEAVVGFLMGSSMAILLGFLFVYIDILRYAFYPYMIGFKAMPVYALAPLFILWFGNGMFPKMVMSATVAFFPVLVNTVQGLSAVPQEKLDLFKSLHATKWQTFIHLRFPFALPFIFPALRVATTFAVVGATIAEFTGASAGIGFVIVNASYYLASSRMFAALLLISISGVLFFYVVGYIEKRIVFW